MATAVGATLGAGGLILLLIGTSIQFRNRSPYSNTPIDEQSLKRAGVGAWIATVGLLLGLVAQLSAAWR